MNGLSEQQLLWTLLFIITNSAVVGLIFALLIRALSSSNVLKQYKRK